MRCRQNLCIYNTSYKYALDYIEINDFVMCDACILMNFDENRISKEKAKQVAKLENRFKLMNQITDEYKKLAELIRKLFILRNQTLSCSLLFIV